MTLNAVTDQTHAEAFTFGDPTPVLNGNDYLDMFEVVNIGDYYEPPISPKGIAKAYDANQHHASAIQVKRNILTSCFIPHRKFTTTAFKKSAFEYLVFGNLYLEQIKNRLGGLHSLKPAPGIPMRRMKEPDQFLQLTPDGNNHKFTPGSIIHVKTDDLKQEIYGVPEYMAALQSALLNEAATLFRRKYYVNGSHAGFIMHVTDSTYSPDDIKGLREALKQAKGPGNFKNLFMYSPGGSADGIKIIPIAEVMAKDEFLNIKNVTRDDVLAAHRVPPHMMGIIPANVGGFGDPVKAVQVFVRNELSVLMGVFKEINDLVGEEVVRFEPYKIEEAHPSAPEQN